MNLALKLAHGAAFQRKIARYGAQAIERSFHKARVISDMGFEMVLYLGKRGWDYQIVASG